MATVNSQNLHHQNEAMSHLCKDICFLRGRFEYELSSREELRIPIKNEATQSGTVRVVRLFSLLREWYECGIFTQRVVHNIAINFSKPFHISRRGI